MDLCRCPRTRRRPVSQPGEVLVVAGAPAGVNGATSTSETEGHRLSKEKKDVLRIATREERGKENRLEMSFRDSNRSKKGK
jgi:hypothetical protein